MVFGGYAAWPSNALPNPAQAAPREKSICLEYLANQPFSAFCDQTMKEWQS
jgi:hypothetical protein